MGTCYYLWREDNRTAYDLGKAYGWGRVFGGDSTSGRDQPMTLTADDAIDCAARLCDALMLAGYAEPIEVENYRSYYEAVCADIARWSDGKPFVFVSEHDGRIEDRSMQAYDEWIDAGHPREHEHSDDAWITGSRFKSSHPEWPDEWPLIAERREHAPLVGKQGYNVKILGCRCGYQITGNVPRTFYLGQPIGTMDPDDELAWHMAQAKAVNSP